MGTAAGKRFFLYHRKSDTTIGNLNWTQTKCVCLTLGNERVKEWYIYTEDFGHWRPLVDVIFEFVKFSSDKYTYPTPPTDEIKFNEKAGGKKPLEDISDDRRDHPRFKRSLELILDMDGFLVESQTIDISLSGVKLKSPKKLVSQPKYIIAMVKLGDEVLDLKLSPLYEDKQGSFQSLVCVGCSDISKWKSQQAEAVSN